MKLQLTKSEVKWGRHGHLHHHRCDRRCFGRCQLFRRPSSPL